MTQTAIFPGTFDPITYGHQDLIKRAAQIFTNVIVAVAENINKKPLFSLEQRIQMVTHVTADLVNVQVVGFSNLLADFAHECGARIIVRGVRMASDFEQELKLASMNRILAKDLETIFLVPDEKHAFISSSLVKEIARMDGDVSAFVNKDIAIALRGV